MRKMTVWYASRRGTARSGSKNRSSGFTLLETLLVVAILVILLGLSMVGVARYRDYLKITELDNAARDIYMAAQNRAVLLKNSGRLDGMLDPDPAGGGHAVKLSSASSNGGTHYISSKTTDSTDLEILNDLIPVGTIDPALRDNGQFYVVYDPVSGSVTDVFFVEKKTDAMPSLDYALSIAQDRDKRMRNKPMLGYYGGSNAEEIGTRPMDTPGVEVLIENGDELTLTVTYTLPANLPAGVTPTCYVRLEYGSSKIILLGDADTGKGETDAKSGRGLKLKDGSKAFSPPPDEEPAKAGDKVTYTCVLDSLDTSKRFRGLTGSGLTDLGGDFKVIASLKLTADGYIDSAYYATGEDNSLFDTSTHNGDTAYIANLRHLQNLDKENSFDSKVGNDITKAEQLCSIDCEKYLGSDYTFTPIVNGSLTSYDGKQWNITKLKAKAEPSSGNAGLFGEITGAGAEDGERAKVQGVRLIDATVSSTGGNAGALAGEAVNCDFIDCQVYWDKPEDLADTSSTPKEINYKVSGKNAGGLVGSASGTVNFTNSFAATTVKGTNAGGLAGSGTDGSLSIGNSYADCYLKAADSAGGLVGLGAAKLTNCYAAGFIVDPTGSTTTAGLVNGSVTNTPANVYSIVRVLKRDTTTGKTTVESPIKPLYTGASDTGSVRYLSKAADVVVPETGPKPFGDAFEYEADKLETNVYNLRHTLDSSAEELAPPYIFPGLKYTVTVTDEGGAETTEIKDLPHYGDWAELGIPSGLVYYEQYSSDPNDTAVYGIDNLEDGATDPLREGAVKDGYALSFENLPEVEYKIKYGTDSVQKWTLEKTTTGIGSAAVVTWSWTKEGETPLSVTPLRGGTLIPLPDEIVTGPLANAANFYQELVCDVGEAAITFYFNPHFAKTVTLGKEETTPEGAKNYKQPDDPTTEAAPAYVRTPRHFYDLSKFQTATAPATTTYNYANKGLCFLQELDIDYETYTEGYESEFPGKFKYIGTGNYMQDPIGTSSAAFNGTYDGGDHIIKNVFFKSGDANLGLFGCSSGTLQNIVYQMDPDPEPDKTPTATGNHVGTLLGYNAGSDAGSGTVENCAVYGVNMKVTGDGWNARVGGLVGYNDGTVKNCAAELADLNVTLPQNTYCAGGLVGGQITGTIENSYAVGKLERSSGYGVIGGLAGENSRISSDGSKKFGSIIENSYAAVELVSPDTKYGLCDGTAPEEATVTNSYWLKGVFRYRGEVYATTGYTGGGTPVYADEFLKKTGLGEKDKRSVQYDIPGTPIWKKDYRNGTSGEGTNQNFPYFTAVTSAFGRDNSGKITGTITGPVHYGLWPVDVPVGLVYYEEYGQEKETVKDESGNVVKNEDGSPKTVTPHGMEGFLSKEGTALTGTLKESTKEPVYNPVVTKDGYALVFENETMLDVVNGYPVTYGGQEFLLRKSDAAAGGSGSVEVVQSVAKWKWMLRQPDGTYTNFQSDIEEFQIKQSAGTTYTVIPLPDKVVTEYLKEDPSRFYQKLVCGEHTFYFNPHFAKTVRLRDTRPDDPSVGDPGLNVYNPSLQGREPVYVRTPRHFFALSRFDYDTEGNLVYYKEVYYFQQELDLDYNTYEWVDPITNRGYGEEAFRPVNRGYYYEQPSISIGRKKDDGTPDTENGVAGTYDGGGHTIRNVFYAIPESSMGLQYLGLFKYISNLFNVTYVVPDGMEVKLTNPLADFSNTDPSNGYKEGIKVGALAGGVFQTSNCTVKITDLTVTSSRADIYVGGMFGYVNGAVNSNNELKWEGAVNCHAVIDGKLEVKRIGTEGRYSHGSRRLDVAAGGLAGVVLNTLRGSTSEVNEIEVIGNDYCYAGGLAGRTSSNIDSSGYYRRMMENCVATVKNLSVTGAGEVYGGGLTGWGDHIFNCEAHVTSGEGAEEEEGLLIVKGAVAYGGGLAGSGSDIQHCTAEAASIKVTGTKGSICGGGLVGALTKGHYTEERSDLFNNFPNVKIQNCTAATTALAVEKTGEETGTVYAGGLAGRVECYIVRHRDNNGNIVDEREFHAVVENCGAEIKSVTAASRGPVYAGGLVGSTSNSDDKISEKTTIKNCYAVGKVSSHGLDAAGVETDAGTVGGFVGQNGGTIQNSYAAVAVLGGASGTKGNFAGENKGTDFSGCNCYCLMGGWIYNGENLQEPAPPNANVGRREYDPLTNLKDTLNAEASPENWGKLKGAEGTVYPFPVSTKKGGAWYYPGSDWPKKP